MIYRRCWEWRTRFWTREQKRASIIFTCVVFAFYLAFVIVAFTNTDFEASVPVNKVSLNSENGEVAILHGAGGEAHTVALFTKDGEQLFRADIKKEEFPSPVVALDNLYVYVYSHKTGASVALSRDGRVVDYFPTEEYIDGLVKKNKENDWKREGKTTSVRCGGYTYILESLFGKFDFSINSGEETKLVYTYEPK